MHVWQVVVISSVTVIGGKNPEAAPAERAFKAQCSVASSWISFPLVRDIAAFSKLTVLHSSFCLFCSLK